MEILEKSFSKFPSWFRSRKKKEKKARGTNQSGTSGQGRFIEWQIAGYLTPRVVQRGTSADTLPSRPGTRVPQIFSERAQRDRTGLREGINRAYRPPPKLEQSVEESRRSLTMTYDHLSGGQGLPSTGTRG